MVCKYKSGLLKERMSRGTLLAIALLFSSVLGLTILQPAGAAEANESDAIVVTERDVVRQVESTQPTDNWVIYSRATAPGTAIFQEGPGDTPLSVGSLELTTATSNDKVFVFNFDHVGTKLNDVSEMSYEAYRTTGNAQQVTALNMIIDHNGPDVEGGFATLVFEPVYNTDQGTVLSGVWQDWDAYNGGNATWWSTKVIPGVPSAFTSYISWKQIVESNPNAVILGGYGINQGTGNANLSTAVDALSIGYGEKSFTYDFELKPLNATNKDECKNGGWTGFQTAYKNQGQCVSSVAKNKN